MRSPAGFARSSPRIEQNTKPDAGRVTARRLNRAEYNNTVRDLLGIDFRPADDFPQDDSGYGFDNIGDVLSLSPVLLEKYLKAAETAVHAAIDGPGTVKPTVMRANRPRANSHCCRSRISEYDLTGLSMPNALHTTMRFPVDGDYVREARRSKAAGRMAPSRCILRSGSMESKCRCSISMRRATAGASICSERNASSACTCRLASIGLQRHSCACMKACRESYGGPNPSKRASAAAARPFQVHEDSGERHAGPDCRHQEEDRRPPRAEQGSRQSCVGSLPGSTRSLQSNGRSARSEPAEDLRRVSDHTAACERRFCRASRGAHSVAR